MSDINITYIFERCFYVIWNVMNKYQFVRAEEMLREQKNYYDKVNLSLTSEEKIIFKQKVNGYLYKLTTQKDVVENTAPETFIEFLNNFYNETK